MAAIESARRRHLRIEGHIVMMGVADTDPLHRGEIEFSALDVTVESRPLIGAYAYFDPDPKQHRLQHLAHSRAFRRSFIDETEVAHPGRADWIASFIE